MMFMFFAGLLLIGGSYFDIKSLTIPRWLFIAGFLGVAAHSTYGVFVGEIKWPEWAVCCLPGVSSLSLSFFTKEQLGYGDGLVLLVLGGLLGGERTLLIWMIGLWISFVISIGLLVMRKGTRQTRLPFVPFMLLGYLVVVGGELII